MCLLCYALDIRKFKYCIVIQSEYCQIVICPYIFLIELFCKGQIYFTCEISYVYQNLPRSWPDFHSSHIWISAQCFFQTKAGLSPGRHQLERPDCATALHHCTLHCTSHCTVYNAVYSAMYTAQYTVVYTALFNGDNPVGCSCEARIDPWVSCARAQPVMPGMGSWTVMAGIQGNTWQ